MNSEKSHLISKISFVAAAIFAVCVICFFACDKACAADTSTPSYTFSENQLGVVNFKPVWNDKKANVASIKTYIEQAYQKDVKILVFPELATTGYMCSDDSSSDEYKAAIAQAETSDGETATEISALAVKYDMWIIYGGTETVSDDSDHAYDSAFVCSPDGKVKTYRKLSPVEGSWCSLGTSACIIDVGKYGKLGVSICHDTYDVPELSSYYSAKGCNIFVNLTAANGVGHIYRSRLEAIAAREGMVVMSADLAGTDGSSGEYSFPGGSTILTANSKTPTYYCGVTGGTGSTSTLLTKKSGLITNSTSVTTHPAKTRSDSIANVFLFKKLYETLVSKEEYTDLSYAYQSIDGPNTAVVTMSAKNKSKSEIQKEMISYIKKAAANDVDLLVFPELGSGTQGDQTALAESIPGETTALIAKYAKKYGMYVIFGMSEVSKHGNYYDSAAIIDPDGNVDSYRKVILSDSEKSWARHGREAKIISTKWGKIGILIGEDADSQVELARYYASMGCSIIVQPAASSDNEWYYNTLIGSYAERDNVSWIRANTAGGTSFVMTVTADDPIDSYYNSTSSLSRLTQDITSNIGYTYGTTGPNAINYNGRSAEGLQICRMEISGGGSRIYNFSPSVFATLYSDLAGEEFSLHARNRRIWGIKGPIRSK